MVILSSINNLNNNTETMAKLEHTPLKVGGTIKIGRREFTIEKGDVIMYNGACWQFIAGNRRTLYYTKNGRYNDSNTNIGIPKKLVKVLKKLHLGIFNLDQEYKKHDVRTYVIK
jgi:hypothetical protein